MGYSCKYNKLPKILSASKAWDPFRRVRKCIWATTFWCYMDLVGARWCCLKVWQTSCDWWNSIVWLTHTWTLWVRDGLSLKSRMPFFVSPQDMRSIQNISGGTDIFRELDLYVYLLNCVLWVLAKAGRNFLMWPFPCSSLAVSLWSDIQYDLDRNYSLQ